MSVKKDVTGRRSVAVEVEVPGTPEEVWAAIATGAGISSWFVPTKSDERAGGQVVCTFGPGMDAAAKITAWEVGKRFATEGDMGMPGSPTVATEWTVEARAGGKCVVRVVHSLFASTDDWDNQLDGLEQGWPTYFRILRLYLERYKGLPCGAMQFVAMSSESEAAAWAKLGGEAAAGGLGLLHLAEGARWSAPAGLPRMAGELDVRGKGMHASNVLLRLDGERPGEGGTAYIGAFACGGMVMVCLSFYLYGAGAKAAAERDAPAWQRWVEERFPAPKG
jgi:uncharacterized protein YndB with AHSA1/START domain